MEMLQLNLSWCELVQRLQRYGFLKIRSDGRTDAGYFIVPLSGSSKLAGDNKSSDGDYNIVLNKRSLHGDRHPDGARRRT